MIKGYYPIEIHRYLEHQIREAAKPQPNLEIANFIIKQNLKLDRLLEKQGNKLQEAEANYYAKLKELQALRDAAEERRLKQGIDPVGKPGIGNSFIDMFFRGKK
ncbi:MAG: hypothetical protein ACQEWD_11360 [Bacteroidota bacterium]